MEFLKYPDLAVWLQLHEMWYRSKQARMSLQIIINTTDRSYSSIVGWYKTMNSHVLSVELSSVDLGSTSSSVLLCISISIKNNRVC